MICQTLPAAPPGAGLRRSAPHLRRAEAAAAGFSGLPAGVSRWRLAAAVRAAARRLDLSAPMLALVEHYIDLTYDVDWTEGSEPVVTRPLVEIAEHLGKSERQVRNIERALALRGLLAFRDSGNHHRKGRRDRATGRLRWAYGPSLAPLAARAAEIVALAADQRAELAEIRRTRIAISALRRRVRARIAELEEEGAPRAGIEALARGLAALPARNPARTPLEALRRQRETLRALLAHAEEAGDPPARDIAEISGLAEKKRRRSPDTSQENSMNGSVIASESRSPRPQEPPRRPAERPAPTPPPRPAEKVPVAVAARAAGPRLGFYLETAGETPSWRGLVEAAERALPDIGIGRTLWARACAVLGREGAALAVLIVDRGLDRAAEGRPPIERPEAYLAAMLDRAASGRLRLERSVFALAAARPS